nr:NADH dehydrogenase [ubiquinone] 1 alpha subcomplex subunit 13-B [Tanacetum cinerariifolium]
MDFSVKLGLVLRGVTVFRAIKEEKYAARRAILPMLQAEEDERFVKEWQKYLEEEARIMKDVPGWKVGKSVYHSGKWIPPATGEMRPEVAGWNPSSTGKFNNLAALASQQL